MANVVLGMPTMGSVQAKTFEALMKINRGEHKLFPLITEYSLVYIARDNIVKRFLENPDADYLWFVDSDIICERETLNAMIADDKDIVTAVYPFKMDIGGIVGIDLELNSVQLNDIVAEDAEGNYKGVIKLIRRCGMGCCLIKRKVFEDVMEKYNTCFTPLQELGEDYTFCERARSLGYEIYLDGGIWCKHIGTKTFEV